MSGKECFQTSIREYDTIRSYLRFMYLYGCCTKKYMTDKGLTTSARKFEEDTRRTRAIIPNRVDESIVSRRRSLRVNVSALDIDENYLASSYFIRAFHEYDFALYFSILFVLSKTPKLGFTALAEKVNKLVKRDEIISDNTIRRFLADMTAEGLIVHKGGYSLPPDPFAELSDEEVRALVTAVDFYKNILPVGVLGEYAHNSLENYTRFTRRMKMPNTLAFMIRYRHLERIVDDDTLLPLIHCIRTRQKARYIYNEKKYEGFPRQIRYDTFYGRQYAVIYDERGRYVLPITNICGVEILPDIADECNKLDSFLNSWFIASAKKETKPPAMVRAWFYIGEDEYYLFERLQREKRHGNLSIVCEGKYLFEIELNDTREILPWLRSFLGHVVIEKSDEHELYELYADYVSEMRVKYGV